MKLGESDNLSVVLSEYNTFLFSQPGIMVAHLLYKQKIPANSVKIFYEAKMSTTLWLAKNLPNRAITY